MSLFINQYDKESKKESDFMGGRGSSSSLSVGAIGKAAPIDLKNDKSVSGYNAWKRTVLEVQDDGNGNITVGYATPKSYEHPNRNTTIANYTLKAAIYNEVGNRSLQSHNINWDKVQSVSGQTYDIKNYIKDMGFKKFDGKNKRWVRS